MREKELCVQELMREKELCVQPGVDEGEGGVCPARG